MYTVQFYADEPASIEWDEGFTSQGLGPGWFTVPTLKIARRCLDAQVISKIESYEDSVDSVIVSTWSTLSQVFFSLEPVPGAPYHVKWEGTADVVFAGDSGTTLTFTGQWMDNGLIAMVWSKGGVGTFKMIKA